MHVRILVTGEADEAKLPLLPRIEQCGVRAFLVEHPVGILEADDLVMLHQIDVIGLQALERFIQLPRGLPLASGRRSWS